MPWCSNARGGRLSRQSCWTIVRRAGERVGLESRPVTPMLLRHSCATHMLDPRRPICGSCRSCSATPSISTTPGVHEGVPPSGLRAAYDAAHPAWRTTSTRNRHAKRGTGRADGPAARKTGSAGRIRPWPKRPTRISARPVDGRKRERVKAELRALGVDRDSYDEGFGRLGSGDGGAGRGRRPSPDRCARHCSTSTTPLTKLDADNYGQCESCGDRHRRGPASRRCPRHGCAWRGASKRR